MNLEKEMKNSNSIIKEGLIRRMLCINQNPAVLQKHESLLLRQLPGTASRRDGDEEYLTLLKENLPAIFEMTPDIILYQAKVNPLKEDSPGGGYSKPIDHSIDAYVGTYSVVKELYR